MHHLIQHRAKALAILMCTLAPVLVEAQIQAPTLGYVPDTELAAVRPILGIPGAATLGEALDLGVAIDAVAVSPRQDYILALSNHHPVLVLPDGSGSLSLVRESASTVDRIVLSPSGSAAALMDSDGRTIQVIAGLPQAPYLARTAAAPTAYGSPTVVAVSDDASLLLAAFSDSGAVFLLTEDAEDAEESTVRPITGFGHV